MTGDQEDQEGQQRQVSGQPVLHRRSDLSKGMPGMASPKPASCGCQGLDSVRTTEGSTTTTLIRSSLGLIVTIRQEVLGVPRSSALDVEPQDPFVLEHSRLLQARRQQSFFSTARNRPDRRGPRFLHRTRRTEEQHRRTQRRAKIAPFRAPASHSGPLVGAPGGNIVWLLGTHHFRNALGPPDRFR